MDQKTSHAVVVDPTGNLEDVHRFLKDQNYTLQAIWLTHTHPDHTDGLAEIRSQYGALPIYVHADGIPALSATADVRPIYDRTELTIGEQRWMVWHTPGHSTDSVCFWHPSTVTNPQSELLTGDTLFVRGCGRTTHTEAAKLHASLKLLTTLPDATTIYPGHNYGPHPTSTIGKEKQHNPYLQTTELSTFLQLRFPDD